ncbi:unnamed protein product, partial [Ectocarpus fasciculatus]
VTSTSHVQTRNTLWSCRLISSAFTRGLAAMRRATTRRSLRRSRCFTSSRARGTQPQRLLCLLYLFLVAGAAALVAFGDSKESMHHTHHHHHGGEGYARAEERRGDSDPAAAAAAAAAASAAMGAGFPNRPSPLPYRRVEGTNRRTSSGGWGVTTSSTRNRGGSPLRGSAARSSTTAFVASPGWRVASGTSS